MREISICYGKKLQILREKIETGSAVVKRTQASVKNRVLS